MTFLKDIFTFLVLSLPFIGAYAMFSVGIVVIYRASRVLNLAHGAMAMVPAYVVFSLVTRWHVPMGLAVVLGILVGALLGLIVERIFVRGLRHLSPTAQTVGTVAVLSLLMAVASKVWGTNAQIAPNVFPKGSINVGASQLDYGSIGLFVVAVVVAFAMLALFKFTDIGLAMRGAAENRRAASLMGINPDRTTALAWALGGALAALAGILLAPTTALHPTRLPLQTLPAYVAALMGALESLPAALGGSAAVGALLGIVPALRSIPIVGDLAAQTGSPQLFLTIAALAIMFTRGQRFSVASRDDGGFAPRATRARRKLKIPWPIALAGILAIVGWVFLPGIEFSILSDANLALVYALIAISLVMLTGWVGQISLGHAALVAVGAFTTGIFARDIGIAFPLNLPLAAGIAGLLAAGLGAIALRVRGLYLAVATLIFSWMADEFLLKQAWFVGKGGSSTIDAAQFGVKRGFPDFDLSNPKIVYLFGLAMVVAGVIAAANIRNSKTGRAFFATRGSETAAASLGINVMRYKLLAFGISGFLAGMAGNLFMMNFRTIQPDQFFFTWSLFFLSIAVVGGLRTLSGAVLAAALFAALNQIFLRIAALGGYLDIVTSGLLVAALLLQARAGSLASLRQRLARLTRRREPRVETIPLPDEAGAESEPRADADAAAGVAPVADGRARDEEGRIAAEPVLRGENITVRFGGLTAVSDATIEIRRGEIVGLIGPNGAGKTTLFNALSGLNEPTEGRVLLFGNDVSKQSVHERARQGLGRTFQIIQLFGDLTVRENLLVATHMHNETGVLRHITATDRAVRAEKDAHRRVQEVIELLDLQDVADRTTAGLPFGILRLVEIGRAVVTEAPVILLDEAASGLDNTETDRLVAFLRRLRDRLGISMLLIEHDVQMVTGISDYMYVLTMGSMISQGSPETVQQDPAVIAAYLGESSAADSHEQPVDSDEREPATVGS